MVARVSPGLGFHFQVVLSSGFQGLLDYFCGCQAKAFGPFYCRDLIPLVIFGCPSIGPDRNSQLLNVWSINVVCLQRIIGQIFCRRLFYCKKQFLIVVVER